MSKPSPESRPAPRIDPRGARFTAGVTLVVFAVVLVTAPSTFALVLLAVQTLFFAIGAGRGVQFTPTALVFKKLIRPRLQPPAELEDAAPPRFAQTVGLAFAVVALAGFATEADWLGYLAAGFALAAATLNAVFGFCLGCELYLLGRRFSSRGAAPDDQIHPTTSDTTIDEATKEEVTA